MLKLHAQKGTEQESNIQSLLSNWQHAKNNKDLREVYSKFQETQRSVNRVKKVIVNLFPLIVNFDYISCE